MTPEARAARERKQKIVLVVGLVVLAGLLAIQLPKLLGGGAEEAAAEETTTAAEASATLPSAAPVAARGLPSAPALAVPGEGKLRSFAALGRKDPFVQQITPPASTGSAQGAGGGEGKEGSGGKASGSAPDLEFSLDGPPAARVTVISVNGTRQALLPGQAFPASDPVFVLVAERPKTKTAVVGIAGGAYESGARTTTLRVGKPLILVNTTTGARYRLVLVAVGNGAAKSAKTTATSPQPAP